LFGCAAALRLAQRFAQRLGLLLARLSSSQRW
jgi:hypothetical protein